MKRKTGEGSAGRQYGKLVHICKKPPQIGLANGFLATAAKARVQNEWPYLPPARKLKKEKCRPTT
jgi:hypothetical protein